MLPIPDRESAGRALAQRLSKYHGRHETFVLALPRGGVPVGYEVAHALEVRFDLLLVRKLGVPWQRELAMGAIAANGVRVLNEDVLRSYGIGLDQIEKVAAQEELELRRRARAYRGDRPWPELRDASVILVDDGIATGATMKAGLAAVREQNPREVCAAIPVAPRDSLEELQLLADDVVCLETPDPFYAIGQWYEDFRQVDDGEVRRLLRRAWQRPLERVEHSEHGRAP